eukprot:CAMPEP_0117571154 /NCGR_PEP_ID=MMETSP0784-20121206/59589_1 /TAXON_ID=39447 /ORGANISM="" /LENGTH=71 /DNA_ID=CAMNT_0005369273 /DNA_START=11 /DNA_END=223 /DNA_ORIENTATION=-
MAAATTATVPLIGLSLALPLPRPVVKLQWCPWRSVDAKALVTCTCVRSASVDTSGMVVPVRLEDGLIVPPK